MDKDLTQHHEAVVDLLDWAEDTIVGQSGFDIPRDELEARFLDKIPDYGELDLPLCISQCDPHDLLKRSLDNYLKDHHADCANLHYLAYYVATHKT